MKSSEDESQPRPRGGNPAPLESVLCTEELNRRPARRPDYEIENRALVALAHVLAESPRTILQTLTDTILEVLQAGSAGISLLTADKKEFYWPAISGAWKPHIGGGTPRDFGPCGDVLDRNAPLMFRHVERRYTYFQPVTPPMQEALLVPFYFEGKAAGTVWAVAHDDRRKFDAEDMRQLVSLGSFASAAYRGAVAVDALEQQGEALRKNRSDLAQNIAELLKANADAWESRRATLNLTEDALRSRQALETRNVDLRESEERYRVLFDLGPVAVYSCDASGRIQDFNRRAVELWGRQPKLGDNFDRFCGSFKLYTTGGVFIPHEQCPMAEVLSGKIPEARDMEAQIERPDGSRITVSVNIRPLKNDRGEITSAINCFVDISERKQVEEELRQNYAGLEKMVEQRTAAVRELSSSLLRSQDDERRRISRELHDSLGQYLAHAKMTLESLKRPEQPEAEAQVLSHLADTLDRCLTETRTISYLLHPPLLDEIGFASAAKWYAEGFSERSGIQVNLSIPDGLNRLSGTLDLVLFRILQESLTNVHRYSHSQSVDIKLESGAGE
ncbi:MAG: histidine kinase, partial [Terriglobia bacterium]